jgi:hypothetical protein
VTTKPFCPCDVGMPQDCKPEDWPGAHDEQHLNLPPPRRRDQEARWRQFRLVAYRCVDRRWLGVTLNRYPDAVIGIAVRVRGRVLSLVWRKAP